MLFWVYCCRDSEHCTVSNSIDNQGSDLNTNVRSRGAFNHHLPHQDVYETLYDIGRIYHVYH
jgi:hypothetical protein